MRSFEIVDIEQTNKFQDIKIPEKFKIDDDKVYIKKTGNVIYITPYHNAWESMLDAANKFSNDFKAGTPIGPLDMLVGAHALSLNVQLVTNNLKEFNT